MLTMKRTAATMIADMSFLPEYLLLLNQCIIHSGRFDFAVSYTSQFGAARELEYVSQDISL